MSDQILPPFGPAPGPEVRDADVLAAFAAARVSGHSRRLHVENDVLYADVMAIVSLRLSRTTLLVRTDLPEDVAEYRPALELALTGAGLSCLDEQTLLGIPVALQMVGLRLSEWDLWGDDIDHAFERLRSIAVGE